jgi:arginase
VAGGRQVAIIGAALDLGAGRRGVDMGPSAIRYAGLHDRLDGLGYDLLDWSDVETAVLEATQVTDETARYLPEIKAACGRVARLVVYALEQGALPLVLGGDHSVAMGTLGGLAKARGAGGVLWIDAHGDLNTPETSPSGNLWGMPFRMLLDAGIVAPEDAALVRARNLDPPEVEFLDAHGIDDSLDRALAGVDAAYVALDLDVLDPSEVDVLVPEPAGASPAEVETLLRGLRERTTIAGIGVTGFLATERNTVLATRMLRAAGFSNGV